MNHWSVSLITLLNKLMLSTIITAEPNEYSGYSSDDIPSICDDPVIYAADRLINNTVRLYRDNYYWELKNLPGDEGFLDGPYHLWYRGFNRVNVNTSLATILNGKRKGYLTRFQGRTWYAWNSEGKQGWGDHGTNSHTIPKRGLTALFHNGNDENPMLIGFQSRNVYYYSTLTDIYCNSSLSNVGSIYGYVGGQYGENFPPDITAAFSYPWINNDSDNYYVYLFRNDKYCFRAAKREDSAQPCEQWRWNKDLFGCDRVSQSALTRENSKIRSEVIPESIDDIVLEEKTNGAHDFNDYKNEYFDYNACIVVTLSFASVCSSFVISILSQIETLI